MFGRIVGAWVCITVWVAAAALLRRRLFSILRERPSVVWLDVGLFAALMLVACGWRNPFCIYFRSVAGLASVCWSARATYGLITAGCA